jgi:MFS family permease
VRRLVLLASAIVLVETVFFSALAPLLPHYEAQFDLSKQEAGILTAVYPLGAVVGAIPSGAFTARVGVKIASILGLVIMLVASVVFGFADSIWLLNVARFCQGIGSALAWTGALAWLIAGSPQERRGELIGYAMGAAIAGALLGPVLGWIATEVGTGPAFTGVAVAAVFLAGWAATVPATKPGKPQRLREVRRALHEPTVLEGVWLVSLAAVLLGVVSVLGPLRLDDLGWSALAISICFLVSAGIEAVLSPFQGRWSDRRGPAAPVRFGLVASIAVSIALVLVDHRSAFLVLLVAAGISYGFFWVPGTAVLSNGTERAGLDLAFGVMILNLAWAPGDVVGAALGGILGQAAGDGTVYLLVAGICMVTLLGSGRLVRRPPPRTRGQADAASPAPSGPGG